MDNHKKQQIHLFLNIGHVTIVILDILFLSNSIKCKKDMNKGRGFMRRISGLITPFCPFKKPAGVNPKWGAFSLPSKWTSSCYLERDPSPVNEFGSVDDRSCGWKAPRGPFYCVFIAFTFTFVHLADAFIQSDLHCIQVTVLHFISSCFPWESNPWSWRCKRHALPFELQESMIWTML